MLKTYCLSLSLLSGCLFFLQSMPVVSAQLAGSGDVLQMLRKIQGRWQTSCFPVVSDGGTRYRQEVLKFSFTQARLEVTDYEQARCVQKRSQHSTTYRFVLTGMLPGMQHSHDGQSVYAIDFNHSDNPMPKTFLAPFNIIRYADGQLLLGLSSSMPVGEEAVLADGEKRLMRLDHGKPFTR